MANDVLFSLEEFDPSKIEPGSSKFEIPSVLLSKLMLHFSDLSEIKESSYNEHYTELKLRAVLDKIVHDSLRCKNSNPAACERSVSYYIPRLSEIGVVENLPLEVAIIEKQLIILSPAISDDFESASLIASLNALLDQSQGANAWLLDLSLVKHVTFELLAFLVGLKLELSKSRINLDLLWLKRGAVPEELLYSIADNFRLKLQGTFLLSY